MGLNPNNGFLFFGPSGTGKTLLARALEFESNVSFITINGAEVMSKYLVQSEENVLKKFEGAKESAPSIIFIDNLDLIAANRNTLQGKIEKRMVAQLLSLMDDFEKRNDIIIVGETDRIDDIDLTFRRAGGFDQEIEFNLPNKEERHEILLAITKNTSKSDNVDLNIITEKTEKYTGADLNGLINDAISLALRKNSYMVNLEKKYYQN